MSANNEKRNAPPRGEEARRVTARPLPARVERGPRARSAVAQPPSLARSVRSRAPEPGETRRPSELSYIRRRCTYHLRERRRNLSLFDSFLMPSDFAEFSERATHSVVSVAGSNSLVFSGVRQMLEIASSVRVAPDALAPGGVARPAAAPSSDTALTRGDARIAPGPNVGSGRGARTRRKNLPVPKGISLDRSDDRARPGVPRP